MGGDGKGPWGNEGEGETYVTFAARHSAPHNLLSIDAAPKREFLQKKLEAKVERPARRTTI